jgi:glucokinase
MQKMRLGIDVGGSSIKSGLVGDSGDVLFRQILKTEAEPAAFCQQIKHLYELSQGFCRSGNTTITGIGIGLPGSINPMTKVVERAPNLHWQDLDIISPLRRLIDGPAIDILNDGDCFAVAEAKFGLACGVDNAIVLTLGTGIGSGIIAGGKLLPGSEAGHMVTHAGGRECGCGKRGCWERYASASAIPIAAQGNPAFADSPTKVFAAAQNGDAKAEKIIKRFAEELACGISGLQELFHPDLIILSGGLTKNDNFPLAQLPDVCRISVLGNEAGIIGAATFSNSAN